MKKKLLILSAIIVVLVVLLFLRGDEDTWICQSNQWVKHGSPQAAKPTSGCEINSFQDCVAAGLPVLESYPRQCRTTDGKSFTESIGNELEKIDLIRLSSPRPNQEISSPLVISGQARGNWFFEASFPVVLVNWDGLIIAQGIAQAQSDWMTNDFVEFETRLEFTPDTTVSNRGSLILKKDNPSGLPQYDDALEIPVSFK